MANLVYRSNLELFREFLRDPERKPLLKVLYELLALSFLYREIPVHYFSRYIFKKEITNYKDFIPNHLTGKISVRINDHKVKEVLDNKLMFNFFYGQFNIPIPNIVIYNHQNVFVANGKALKINDENQFTDLLTDVFDKNPSFESLIVKKTSASSSGKKIFRINHDQVKSSPALMREIYLEVVKSGFLFQETIKQHPEMDAINHSCLNTIRIDTFINPDGNVEIGSAYLRMSIRNAHIDNISSGGCQVGINSETGRLKSVGYSLIKTEGVQVFREHPVTGIRFEDFKIPCFTEVKELVIRTAGFMPGLRLIGWDVAIGENGPVLIEGNSDYDLSGNDIAYGGYMANKVFIKVLKELKYIG
jgi:hypothetical protein